MTQQGDSLETDSQRNLPPGRPFLIIGVIAVFSVALFAGMILNHGLRSRMPTLRNPVTQPQVIRKSAADRFKGVITTTHAQAGGLAGPDTALAASGSLVYPGVSRNENEV
jgi:hypothetical protein